MNKLPNYRIKKRKSKWEMHSDWLIPEQIVLQILFILQYSLNSKCQKFGEIRRDEEERIRIIVGGH